MLIKDGESKVDSSDGMSLSSMSVMCTHVKGMEIMEKVLKDKTEALDFGKIFEEVAKKHLKATRFSDIGKEMSQELSNVRNQNETTPKGKSKISVAPVGLSVHAVYNKTSVAFYPISKGKREYVNNILFILSNILYEITGGKIVATNHLNLISDSEFAKEKSLERAKNMLNKKDADIVCLPVAYGDSALLYSFILKTEEQEEESKKSFIVYTFISSPLNKTDQSKLKKALNSCISKQLFNKDVDIREHFFLSKENSYAEFEYYMKIKLSPNVFKSMEAVAVKMLELCGVEKKFTRENQVSGLDVGFLYAVDYLGGISGNNRLFQSFKTFKEVNTEQSFKQRTETFAKRLVEKFCPSLFEVRFGEDVGKEFDEFDVRDYVCSQLAFGFKENNTGELTLYFVITQCMIDV